MAVNCNRPVIGWISAASLLSTALAPAAEEDLPEVVVTAGKIAEPLAQAPYSLLVVRAAELENAGILDFDDLPQIAPSLTISRTTQPANNSIHIRGIGTYAFSIAVEPSVAVVVDDLPLAFQPAAFTALADVEQVEVLRGPQSTLFGRSSNAGVIRLTTLPVSDVLTGRWQALIADDHERRVQGTVSGPIAPELGYRFSANFSDFRGTLRNLSTGNWLNGQSDINLRGKLEWRPDNRWRIGVTPFWTRTEGSCCAAAETFLPPGATTGSAATGAARIPAEAFLSGVAPGPGNRLLRMDVDARGDARHEGVGLRAEFHTGNLTFLSLGSFEHYTLQDLQDTDSTDIDFSRYQSASPPGGSANGGSLSVISRTQELRVSSSGDQPLSFVAGAFWSSTGSRRQFVRGSNDLDDYSAATPPGAILRPVLPASLPTTNDTSFSRYRASAHAESLAAFGQGTWALLPDLDLLAGIRRAREKTSYSFLDEVNGVAFGTPRCATLTPSGIPIQTCSRDNATTGRIGLRARPAPGWMGFATYSRGHKGRAYDLSSTLTLRGPAPASSAYPGRPLADVIAARQPVPAEQVDNYELGFKYSTPGGQWWLDVTAYRMVVRNFQAQSRDLQLGQNVLNSLGRVTSRGVEAESSAVFGRFSLNVAAAHGRAVIGNFPGASCYRGQTVAEGCVSGVQNLMGSLLPNAPQWSGSLQGRYRMPLGGGLEAHAALALRWQSATNFSLLRDPAARQSAYGVVNATFGLRTGAWQGHLFVNNVFNQRFLLNGGRDTHINNPAGQAFATNWRPGRESQRATGIRVSYAF